MSPLSKKLNEDSWLYHTYHLADNQEIASDCNVCIWYNRLGDSSLEEMMQKSVTLQMMKEPKKEY